MVAAVTDIVSIADMKLELRIPLWEVGAHDAMIARQITAAVSWIATETGLPLLDEGHTFDAWFPADAHDPLPLGTGHLRRLVSVAYWLAANPARGQPGGTIAVRTLLRIERGAGSIFWCWPPVTGWPSGRRPDTPARVALVVGLAVVPAALRQAIILTTREYYDGRHILKRNHPVFSIINAFRMHS